jgi:uncharacterized protein (DUF58 family)
LLTARGWWLVAIAAILTLAGVGFAGGWSPAVPVLGLALAIWVFAEWFLFNVRLRSAVGKVRVERALLQGGRPVPVVWAGMTATVRLTITLDAPVRLPFVWIEDRVPAGYLDLVGAVKVLVSLKPGEAVTLDYEIKPPLPGLLRFEGVTLRVADLAGLLYRRWFLRGPVEFVVMPSLRDEEGKHRGEKRINTLPPPGGHRLRRPGGGSELLDLRDYVAGDPPKTIAWKVSARKDKLITKEFENDVPVRCVVFLDTSEGMRVGPHWATPVAKLADCAAAIGQAAAANRDLIGLTTFDETDAPSIPPARTTAHTLRLMKATAEAAALMPRMPQLNADRLVKASLAVASELYPDLLDGSVNSLPKAMYWKPISDSRWGFLLLPMYFAPAILALTFLFAPAVANGFFAVANALAPRGWGWVAALTLVALSPFVAYQIWFWYGVRGFFPTNRQRTRERKQLGLVFAALDGSGPGTVARTMHDDDYVRTRANRFLTDHSVRLTPTLVDTQGRYRFRSPEKAEVLARALLRAVARARDNELYVILADFVSLGTDGVDPVVRAVKAARARKHQVLVVVPWPDGLAKPPDANVRTALPPAPTLAAITRRAIEAGFTKGFTELRRTLVAAGATVIRIDKDEPVKLVLDKMDRLRGVRVRR